MIFQLIDFIEVTVLSTRGTLFVTGARLTRKMIALRLISIGDIIKYHKPPDTVGEPVSMLKADLSARDFPCSLCSKKLYTE
jgi:hypothetical protein